MNKAYHLADSKTILASSHEDFLKKLRNTSFFPCETDADYMADFAKRFYVIFNKHLPSTNIPLFVEGLIFHNLVYISELN